MPNTRAMSATKTLHPFTSAILIAWRDDQNDDHYEWLADHPKHVAEVQVYYALHGHGSAPVYRARFAVRVRDEVNPADWRVAVYDAPLDALRRCGLDPARLDGSVKDYNFHVLDILTTEANTNPDTMALREVLARLVVPDLSEIGPDWAVDFD